MLLLYKKYECSSHVVCVDGGEAESLRGMVSQYGVMVQEAVNKKIYDATLLEPVQNVLSIIVLR